MESHFLEHVATPSDEQLHSIAFRPSPSTRPPPSKRIPCQSMSTTLPILLSVCVCDAISVQHHPMLKIPEDRQFSHSCEWQLEVSCLILNESSLLMIVIGIRLGHCWRKSDSDQTLLSLWAHVSARYTITWNERRGEGSRGKEGGGRLESRDRK